MSAPPSPTATALAPAQRCLAPYLLNGAIFWVYWLATTLIAVLLIHADGYTRFDAGAAVPQSRLAAIVVADPEKPDGAAKIVLGKQLAAFRARYPDAALAPPLSVGTTLDQRPDGQRSYRLRYSARAGDKPGEIEVIARTRALILDSPGAFGSLELRYRVSNNRIELRSMREFDPFMSWFFSAFLGFFVLLAVMMLAEWRLIHRPLAKGRWLMLPPVNRDWLVSRGIPLSFSPVPPSLSGLADALRQVGAKVRCEDAQGALSARLGQRAQLVARLGLPDQSLPQLEILIDGGLTPLGTLLLILVAPLAGLLAASIAFFWLSDPLAESNTPGFWIAGLSLLSVASASIDALAAQGAHVVPPRRWPKVSVPLPAWRRRLPKIFFGFMLVGILLALLLPAVLQLFR